LIKVLYASRGDSPGFGARYSFECLTIKFVQRKTPPRLDGPWAGLRVIRGDSPVPAQRQIAYIAEFDRIVDPTKMIQPYVAER